MNLREATIRVAALKVVAEALEARNKELRGETLALLTSAQTALGVKSVDVALPDGTKVGTITLTTTGGTPSIKLNDAALLALVETDAPTEIVRSVNPAYVTALKKRLVIDGDKVIDKTTGEVVEWASVLPAAPTSKSFSVTFAKGGRDQVKAAFADGRLDLLEALAPREIEGGEQA